MFLEAGGDMWRLVKVKLARSSTRHLMRRDCAVASDVCDQSKMGMGSKILHQSLIGAHPFWRAGWTRVTQAKQQGIGRWYDVLFAGSRWHWLALAGTG